MTCNIGAMRSRAAVSRAGRTGARRKRTYRLLPPCEWLGWNRWGSGLEVRVRWSELPPTSRRLFETLCERVLAHAA
jgi:hypothetical protein